MPLIVAANCPPADNIEVVEAALAQGAHEITPQRDAIHLQHAVRREIANLDARREAAQLRIALWKCGQRGAGIRNGI